MATLYIRESEKQIDKIKFDGSYDFLLEYGGYLKIYKDWNEEEVTLVSMHEIDHLILALQKAKELWGK